MVIINAINALTKVKGSLHDLFKIKDLGEAKYFLGMEIIKTGQGIHLIQRKYALDLLKESGFMLSKPASTLMESDT